MRYNSPPALAALSPADRLRVELNDETDATKRNVLYSKIKQLDREQRGPQPAARLRGA
jgi:hypothetical protein